MNDIFSFSGAFEVVCFIFLAIALKRVFSQNLVGPLKEALQEKEEGIIKLRESYTQVQQENKALVEQGIEQEEYANMLLKKIKQWGEQEQERSKTFKKEQKSAQKRVEEYLEAKLEWIKIDHTRQEILPKALEKAEQQLIKKFENKAAQEVFLDEVLPKTQRDNA